MSFGFGFGFGFGLVQAFGFGRNFGSKCNRKPKYEDTVFKQYKKLFESISSNIPKKKKSFNLF
jgi:hypothetical protein